MKTQVQLSDGSVHGAGFRVEGVARSQVQNWGCGREGFRCSVEGFVLWAFRVQALRVQANLVCAFSHITYMPLGKS